jgi:hypothetical protein
VRAQPSSFVDRTVLIVEKDEVAERRRGVGLHARDDVRVHLHGECDGRVPDSGTRVGDTYDSSGFDARSVYVETFCPFPDSRAGRRDGGTRVPGSRRSVLFDPSGSPDPGGRRGSADDRLRCQLYKAPWRIGALTGSKPMARTS